MGDLRFIMGNAVIIIGLAFAFSYGGLADMLDEDVDIGPDGEDFDTNRLSFQLNESFQVDTGTQNTLIWDGTENDRTESYGYVRYNLTDVEEFTLDVQTSRFAFLSGLSVYINDVELAGTIDVPTNGRNIYDVDEKMQQYGISGEPETMEVRINNEESRITDVGGGLDFEDFINQSSIIEEDYDVEVSAFDQIASSLSTSLAALGQLPGIISAWVSFSFAIPGTMGTFFQMYIGAFIIFFLVMYVWIG